jgi:redox-sensitive bicupin YhaK (pirin superfamily)
VLPFGPHPHRGFETVTFILEGESSDAAILFEHAEPLGEPVVAMVHS